MNGDTTSARSWTDTARSAAGEVAALAQVIVSLPLRGLAAHTLGELDVHPVPVVLVHGLLGDPTNFAVLRRHLARHGIRRFSSFGYRPRFDYQRIAQDLQAHVESVRRETGAMQVDVIGHSLGGLVARYFVQIGGACNVRRLVTLGTPYLGTTNPAQELAIFAADDAIVPPPTDGMRRRMRVVRSCGHLGLLTDGRSLDIIVRFLAPPLSVVGRVADSAA